MRQPAGARTTNGRTVRPTAVVLILVFVAGIGTLVHVTMSSSTASFGDVLRGDLGGATRDGAVTVEDGVLPEGVTVFDDQYPGVANLDPELLQALRDAATDAGADGIAFHVNSGWRSAEHQDQLLREAVAAYGSEAEAARWVATADTSAHVSGDAVDLGPAEAAAWLSAHGAGYGLCQTYLNEAWHFERRPEAIGRGCPPPYADPTQDPRMQA